MCSPGSSRTARTETAVRIASRYIGPEKGAAYVGSAGDHVIIRLEPGDLRVWDFADEYDEMGS